MTSLFHLPALLAQEPNPYAEMPPINPAVSGTVGLIGLAVVILMIASLWKIFTKAGQPGWASLIPIYNIYILCKIAGKSGWWVLLLLIPIIGVLFSIFLCISLAENFGKGAGYGIGLVLLGIVFFPMLAFGDAQYRGPAAGALTA